MTMLWLHGNTSGRSLLNSYLEREALDLRGCLCRVLSFVACILFITGHTLVVDGGITC